MVALVVDFQTVDWSIATLHLFTINVGFDREVVADGHIQVGSSWQAKREDFCVMCYTLDAFHTA